MAGPLDHQYNVGVESVYGTGVTPTRSYEWDFGSSKHNWDPKPIQGSGMQPGDGGFERADRMVIVIGQGSGTVGMDVQTKGMGLIFNGLSDTGVATLVGGSTYQHLFTSTMTDGLLPSHTHQYGVVRSDASGTVDVYTYLGVTFSKLSMKCDSGGVMTMTADWDAKARTEATALATTADPDELVAPFHYR
jgi:Phage tail tube protein